MSSLKLLSELPSNEIVLPSNQDGCDSIPDVTSTYLRHAIGNASPLRSSVRLEMTGEIKLKKWLPFTATQVVRVDRGFVWSAKVKTGLAFIRGFDQFIDGVGEMRWKLFGLIPVMSGKGPDISRSAGDRYAIERVLLPSAFCRHEVRWTGDAIALTVEAPGVSPITLGLDSSGRVVSVSMLRWGNPDGGTFGMFPFGGYVDSETTWDGYTIPSRLRIGWFFGSDRFEEGEFFRATITHAAFK